MSSDSSTCLKDEHHRGQTKILFHHLCCSTRGFPDIPSIFLTFTTESPSINIRPSPFSNYFALYLRYLNEFTTLSSNFSLFPQKIKHIFLPATLNIAQLLVLRHVELSGARRGCSLRGDSGGQETRLRNISALRRDRDIPTTSEISSSFSVLYPFCY